MAKNRTFHDSAIHRRHENSRDSHFPQIQAPRLPSCSLERCAGSSDTGSVKNAQPQSRERSTLVRRRRMVQSPHCMSTDSTLRSRAGQRRVVSPRIQRQRPNPRILTDDSPMISHSVFQTAESAHPCTESCVIQNPIPADSHSILAQNLWIHNQIPAGF